MKTWVLLGALVCAVAMPVLAGPATEKSWFDMQNCPMCKAMTAETGLMENMSWDTYATATGCAGVCTVDPKYKEAYARAGAKMEATLKDLEAGKDVGPLCGYCTSYGTLVKAGAKSEMFATPTGHLMLLSSTDPAVITKIQAHAKRTSEETAKMKAAMKASATGK